MKRFVSFGLKLVVTAGLFVLLFWPEFYGLSPDLFGGVKPIDLLNEVREAGARNVVFWLVFATLVKLAGMLAGVLRWRLLLHGQGLKMPFWYMVQSWFVGRFIGIFLPGTIGLDGYRLYDSSRYTGDVIKSTTVIAVEKLIGLIALTGLVFVTFPLSLRMLEINPGVLAVILLILGGMVAFFFLLLLNPRLIQILVAVLPVPAGVRNQFNKLGAAATAYSHNRKALLLAVLFGFMVHIGTCFMFFGTMMAIRAPNTNLLDILFASPLMIYGTVLGPSVGGEGIREIVFVTLLKGKSGAAAAATFAHLGWWVGEVVPFLIGLPIYLFRSRPDKEQLESEVRDVREQAARAEQYIHLPDDEVRAYRSKLIDSGLAGVMAGLVAGAIVGIVESAWIMKSLDGLNEAGMFWWGPLIYGILFVPVGLGIAEGLSFIYLLVGRFPSARLTTALSLGGSLAAGVLLIGGWRFYRDVLEKHAPSLPQAVMIGGAAVCVGIVVVIAAFVILRVLPGGRRSGIAGGIGSYIVLIVVGAFLSAAMKPAAPSTPAFDPETQAKGPNIILLAADALRADYLRMYADSAQADTPNLDALRKDAVFFENCFAASTWTKPSFATLFSGKYPESHTATSKTSPLPEEIVTVAELLEDAGYYTRGFANNPNIMSIFDFDQGFVEYTDLKPASYIFGATPSASKLTAHEVLRKGRQRLLSKITDKLTVTEFYQPAENVTRAALDFLDSGAVPDGNPFYLFLHYMDPHDPFMDAETGVGYARARMENPDPELREPMRDAYNDDIAHMDKYIGVLLDGLKERGLYNNSLIVFTADHGEEFYDHQGWWHGQTLYDELMHVPLIIKLPDNTRAGEKNPYLAGLIDIPTTFLPFAGVEPPESLCGLSLFGADMQDMNRDRTFVYAEVDFEGNDLQAVRTYDAKVIHANPDNPRGIAPFEFYDLTKDSAEQKNLAGTDHPRKEQEKELDKLVDEMLEFTTTNAAEPVYKPEATQSVEEQMEALGYL